MGVGHPKQAFPLMRRADAASRQIGGPKPISEYVHVKANSGEPDPAKVSRNLFANDR